MSARPDGAFAAAVGRRIAEQRVVVGLSQAELARYVRTSQTSISNYELGKRVPPLDLAARICDVLGLSLDALVELPKMGPRRAL